MEHDLATYRKKVLDLACRVSWFVKHNACVPSCIMLVASVDYDPCLFLIDQQG